MNYKAVIFDMDGTIFDTEPISCLSWHQAEKDLGFETPHEFILTCMGLPSEEIGKKLIALHGDSFDYELFREKKIAYADIYLKEHGVPLKPGLEELLKAIKKAGMKCAVATSTSRNRAMYHIDESGFTPYFSVIICGDQIENGKPNPDIYLKAAELLGVKPEDCIAVEDSRNGIFAAHNANMFSVLIPDMVPPDAEMLNAADVVLDSLTDVIEYL